MKTLRYFVTFILLAILVYSCSKDDGPTDEGSDALVGTTWASRSSVNPTTNYRILKFKDRTNLDWITKNSSSSTETTMSLSYKLDNNTLTIKDDVLTWTGEIEGERFNLRPDIGSNFMTFIKE